MKKFTIEISDRKALIQLRRLIYMPMEFVREIEPDFSITSYKCTYIPIYWKNYFVYGDDHLILAGNVLISNNTIILETDRYTVKIYRHLFQNFNFGKEEEEFTIKSVKLFLRKFPLQILKNCKTHYEAYNLKWSNEKNIDDKVENMEIINIDNYDFHIEHHGEIIFKLKVGEDICPY